MNMIKVAISIIGGRQINSANGSGMLANHLEQSKYNLDFVIHLNKLQMG